MSLAAPVPSPLGVAHPPVPLGRLKGSVGARIRSARRAAVAGALLGAAGLAGGAVTIAGSPLVGISLLVATGLLVPLAVGAWARAQALAIDTAGSSHPLLPLRILLLHPRGPFEAPDPRWNAVLLQAARAWASGTRVLVLVPAGLLAGAARRLLLRGEVADALHAEADVEALAARLQAFGLAVGVDRGRLRLQPPPGEEGAPLRGETVTLRVARLPVPRVRHGGMLVLRGPPKGVRRVRKLVETDLLAEVRFCWSTPARRLEARLDGLARDAARAATTEELATLLADVKGVQAVLARRDFILEDAMVLNEKAHRLRDTLEGRLLSGPIGTKGPDRGIAPAPALLPDVGRLVDAANGFSDAAASLTYLPFYLVPHLSRLGGGEVLVDATTLAPDAEESARLLEAAESGCTRILESGRNASFAPAAPVTPHVLDAIEADLRARLHLEGPLVLDAAAVEVLYVPYVRAAEGGLVSAVTGRPASKK